MATTLQKVAIGGAVLGLGYLLLKPKEARAKRPPIVIEPPEPVEPGEPVEPLVELRVELVDPFDKATARFVSDDARVDITGSSAVITASTLPVDVLVSFPERFEPSDAVDVGEGNKLVGGIPGKSRDFVFRIRKRSENEDFSAFLTANFFIFDVRHNVPLRIYVP